MRTSAGATIGVVTEGMYVQTTLSIGIVSADIPGDGSRCRLGLLLEGDGALDVGVTTEICNYMVGVTLACFTF